jgi:hypothetical protein
MKYKMILVIAWILIGAGIGFFASAFLARYWYEWTQEKMLDAIQIAARRTTGT